MLNAPETPAIRTRSLTKTFRAVRAVDDVDLEVPAGGVFGLLGPNGAGKTTIIRILATLARPDSGRAQVFGHDVINAPDAVRRSIALVGQFASLDKALTGWENLVLHARMQGVPRSEARRQAADVLDRLGLTEVARRPIRTYSGGMLRRLDIAASVLLAPPLLFLDEPTTGLDPHSRSQVWDIVRALVERGTTVVLTTQYLEEADQLADRLAVLDRGTIIADDTPARLKASTGTGVLQIRVSEPAQRAPARHILAEALGVAVDPESDPTTLSARIGTAAADPAAGGLVRDAVAGLADAGISVAAFGLGQPSLDEVFLALTGHSANDPSGDDS
ncbi:MAG TPA: ATP-binding cassette domain-containing protein [Jatrophihabitantaceae bacterium]